SADRQARPPRAPSERPESRRGAILAESIRLVPGQPTRMTRVLVLPSTFLPPVAYPAAGRLGLVSADREDRRDGS
ncbi:MAG: hypothetical protein ACRCYR_02455, partial [Phycicoccus sp.]